MNKSLRHLVFSVVAVGLVSCSFSDLDDASSFWPRFAGPVSNEGTIRTKNFRELMEGVEGPFGTSLSNNERALIAPRLPQTNDATQLNPASMHAIINLGDLACNDLSNAEASSNRPVKRAYGAVSFSTAGYAALKQNDSSQQEAVIATLAGILWQRSVTAEEMAILKEALNELLELREQARGRNGNSTDLRMVLANLCTIMAASIDAIRS